MSPAEYKQQQVANGMAILGLIAALAILGWVCWSLASAREEIRQLRQQTTTNSSTIK